MTERWWTADLHLGHVNIIDYTNRPFASVTEMNEVLVDNWNETVGVHDSVYVLGDFAMGKITDTLPLAGILNGYKILIPGNHDRCWIGHSEKRRKGWDRQYLDAGFNEIWQGFIPYSLNGEDSIMCHFPYSGDSHDNDRFADQRPIDRGLPVLHGHVHEAWKTRLSDQGSLMVNVGVDVRNFRPVHEDVLTTEIRGES